MKAEWTTAHTLGLIVLILAWILVGLNLVWFPSPQVAWYMVLILFALFVIVAGHGITGRVAGFMIDSRSRMSLSQLQLVLWTVVVLSAYLTAALARLPDHGVEALALALPPELWWLMGISTTSLIGTPLILSNKREGKANTTERAEAAGRISKLEGVSPQVARERLERESQGLVLRNPTPQDARIHNLLTGDEIGNGGYLDLGKLQMLLFTLVLVFVYAVTLGGEMTKLIAKGEFPALDQSMLALLGISHAGYLWFKAAPHSRSEPVGRAGAGAGGNVDRGTPVPLETKSPTSSPQREPETEAAERRGWGWLLWRR